MSNDATIYWNRILAYIKSDHCKDVHKIYSESEGWLYVTDAFGERHRIADTDSFEYAKKIIDHANPKKN